MISHIPTRRRRSYTPTFRLQVIAETRTPGTSVAKVARRHDLNTNVVFHWLRDPRYNGKAGRRSSCRWKPGQPRWSKSPQLQAGSMW
jgi:transposase-like protein